MISGSPNALHRDGDDDGAREKLVALRGALLRLHNISEFVVRIDETLTGKAPVAGPDSETAFDLARKMFTPTESGDTFQKQYFHAIQRDPAVVMEHAELARLFSQTLRCDTKE